MTRETLPCVLCGKPIVEGDVVVPTETVGTLAWDPSRVHLRCLRPAPRTTPPVPPLLSDEDLAE